MATGTGILDPASQFIILTISSLVINFMLVDFVCLGWHLGHKTYPVVRSLLIFAFTVSGFFLICWLMMLMICLSRNFRGLLRLH